MPWRDGVFCYSCSKLQRLITRKIGSFPVSAPKTHFFLSVYHLTGSLASTSWGFPVAGKCRNSRIVLAARASPYTARPLPCLQIQSLGRGSIELPSRSYLEHQEKSGRIFHFPFRVQVTVLPNFPFVRRFKIFFPRRRKLNLYSDPLCNLTHPSGLSSVPCESQAGGMR